MIYVLAQTLAIRAVIAFLTVILGHALVKMNAEIVHRRKNKFNRALYLALGVGVFNPEIKNAAALVGKPFAYYGVVQVSEVNKACRAGSDTGNLCPLGQIPLRIKRLIILGCFVDMRKQKLRQFVIIHYLSSGKLV